MLGGKFRQKLKSSFFETGKILSFLPLTANQFTALSIPFALIAAFFLLLQNLFVALFFIILAVLIDVLDGSFAEAKNQKSNFGNYFDAVVDKIVECIFYFGFAFIAPIPAILALAGTMLESYAKPRVGLVIITDNHDWPAIGERSDRLLVLIIGLFFATIIPQFSHIIIPSILVLIFAITTIGFVQRIFYAKSLIQEAESKRKLLPYLRARKKH